MKENWQIFLLILIVNWIYFVFLICIQISAFTQNEVPNTEKSLDALGCYFPCKPFGYDNNHSKTKWLIDVGVLSWAVIKLTNFESQKQVESVVATHSDKKKTFYFHHWCLVSSSTPNLGYICWFSTLRCFFPITSVFLSYRKTMVTSGLETYLNLAFFY